MRLRRSSNPQPFVVGESNRIGAGGEGTVYRIDGGLAVKVFKKPAPRRAKIVAMLANPPHDSFTPGHDSIAWPLDQVLDADSGSFLGYSMPRVDNAGGFREVAHFKNRITKRPHFTNFELHVVALNLASALSALHKKGYVVGDVNDRNLLVSQRGLVTVLDTDSFQVPRPGGTGFFRCAVKTPEFTPPELQPRNPGRIDRREEHDLFGLGVLLFQLLMQGHHPFNGSDDHGWSIATRIEKGNFPFGQRHQPIRPVPHAPSLAVLDDELAELFVRCFEDGARDPRARPRAAEWRRALDRVRRNMQTCVKSDHHIFPATLSACPWCDIRRRVVLDGGQGLDYFPEDVSQVPLAQPARGKVLKSVVRAGPASGPSWGPLNPPPNLGLGSSVPKPPPAAQTASTAGPTSTGSQGQPTLGGLAIKALGALAGAYLNRATGGSAGGVPGSVPGAHFTAGNWHFRLLTPVPPLAGPILLGGQLLLASDGSFTGSGQVRNTFQQSACQLSGQWQYDPHSRTLIASTSIDGRYAGQDQLRVVGGVSGRLQVATADGRQFAFSSSI